MRIDVERLIRDDNKTEFTSFLRSQPRNHGCDFSPSQLLKLICVHRAIECATSFFEETSGYHVDLNVALEGGMLPLQHAAESLSFRLTSLFLEHGADANVPGNLQLLPLNFALRGVSDKCLCDWSPEKSLLKLLLIFFMRDLKEPMDTITLLAERTEDIEKVASYCVEEEQEVVRLVALLMGAWKRLMPTYVENEEKILVGQLIWRRICDVVNEELRVMILFGLDCEQLELLKSRKTNLLLKWRFLKLLEIARDVINNCRGSEEFRDFDNFEVPHHVLNLLATESYLEVNPDDDYSGDVECMRPKLPAEMKAQLNETIEKQLQLHSMTRERKTSAGPIKSRASPRKELSVRTRVSSFVAIMRNDIEKLIRDDNKTEFTSFLRSQPRNHASDFSPSELLTLICVHRAVECATSFFEETSGYHIDLNVALEDGMLPLQHAAQSLSFRLTSLFLEHGADANVSENLSLLPLNFALKAVSDKWLRDWSPEKSTYKLLFIFFLRDLNEPLDTIALLAERTQDIEKLISYCVEEQEIFGLAALLMGAWKRLMPTENAENSLVGQLIWTRMYDVVEEELRLMIMFGSDCEQLELLKSRKINLLIKWSFLKLLEIARDVINKYRGSKKFRDYDNFKVPHQVLHLLASESCLVVNPDDEYSDDVECLRPKLPAEMKAQLNEAIEKQLQLQSMTCERKTSAGPIKSRASPRKELSVRTRVVSSLVAVPVEGGGCCSNWSSVSISRAYHTRRDLSISFGKMVEHEVPNKLARPPLLAFTSSAKICARLLLFAKRSIK